MKEVRSPGRDLAWHMYFEDPSRLQKQREREKSGAFGLLGDPPDRARFAAACQAARPGIRGGLSVLLGPDFAKKPELFADRCEGSLDRLHALLTQAGCTLGPEDAFVVERLFAAAVSSHGKIACCLSPHERLTKTDTAALTGEDMRFRPGKMPAVTCDMRKTIGSPLSARGAGPGFTRTWQGADGPAPLRLCSPRPDHRGGQVPGIRSSSLPQSKHAARLGQSKWGGTALK